MCAKMEKVNRMQGRESERDGCYLSTLLYRRIEYDFPDLLGYF